MYKLMWTFEGKQWSIQGNESFILQVYDVCRKKGMPAMIIGSDGDVIIR